MDDPYLRVARVVKTHGLDGMVAVEPVSGVPLVSLQGVQVWIVPPHDALRNTEVVAVRQGPKGSLFELAGVHTRSLARELCGRMLIARTDDLPSVATETGSDVIGMSVVEVDRGVLGRIEDLIVTGANDVWVVRGERGEVLVPVIEDVVLGYDEETHTVTVRLLPGLLDEDD